MRNYCCSAVTLIFWKEKAQYSSYNFRAFVNCDENDFLWMHQFLTGIALGTHTLPDLDQLCSTVLEFVNIAIKDVKQLHWGCDSLVTPAYVSAPVLVCLLLAIGTFIQDVPQNEDWSLKANDLKISAYLFHKFK